MELINKIFRKQRENRAYRFGEKALKNEIKDLAEQGKLKGNLLL